MRYTGSIFAEFQSAWIVEEKRLWATVELRAQLTAFFHRAGSRFEKLLTDKLRLFRLGHLADSFFKMNKVRLSL